MGSEKFSIIQLNPKNKNPNTINPIDNLLNFFIVSPIFTTIPFYGIHFRYVTKYLFNHSNV